MGKNYQNVKDTIVQWLIEQQQKSGLKGFVVGVSGGIDSAVTSTLCALTELPTVCLTLPILQPHDQHDRAHEHLNWLKDQHKNVQTLEIDLSQIFVDFENTLPDMAKTELSLANSRSRLRMTALYALANAQSSLVVGTGNKIEDIGIGFFTKYGDGGVDISPIGDLVKSEVFALAEHLGVNESLRQAHPTDGLWEDDRTDEEQIGASYDELEWAMALCDRQPLRSLKDVETIDGLSAREREVLRIYLSRHLAHEHKMVMPPVCFLG